MRCVLLCRVSPPNNSKPSHPCDCLTEGHYALARREEILDEWLVDHGGTWAERQGGMLCLGSVLASCSAEILAAVRSNCEAAVGKGLADENLPVQAASVGAMAALSLAALRHGEDATMPVKKLAGLLVASVTEVRTAALIGVITIGKELMADADVDDALESTAGVEKLTPYVVALGEPIFKATKERNYTVRDLAVKALAWLMQVRSTHCPSQLPAYSLNFATLCLLCCMHLTSVRVSVADYVQLKPSQVTDSELIDTFSSGSKKPEVVKGVNSLFASAKLCEALNAYAGGVA
eukprot:COSAG02_NODE_324_length_24643_cov_107.975228_5_plen_292_part_00